LERRFGVDYSSTGVKRVLEETDLQNKTTFKNITHDGFKKGIVKPMIQFLSL
jgi:hypothetical protein